MDAFPTPEAEADAVFDIRLGNIRDLNRRSQETRSEIRQGVNRMVTGLLVALIFTGAWVFYGAPAYERIAKINQENVHVARR